MFGEGIVLGRHLCYLVVLANVSAFPGGYQASLPIVAHCFLGMPLVYALAGLVFRPLFLVCSFFAMLLFIVQYGRLDYSLDQTMTIPDKIINYFDGRLSSGFVEGLNNKVKTVKRRCYGVLRVDTLFQRLHLDLEGYRRFT